MASATPIERGEKFQTVFAREADKRRKSTAVKKDANNVVQRDDKLSTPGLLRRMAISVSRAESLVLPRDNPRKAYIAPLYPNIFSIEATAQERSISDNEEIVLLAVKNTIPGSDIEPVNLRWMHLPHEGIEFGAFLRSTLEAYGLGKQAEALITSQSLDQALSSFQTSSFQGKRFLACSVCKNVILPGSSDETRINMMAVPYFWRGKTLERRNRSHSSKAHWTQPLVQSAYHLDSSISRENQQAIRRLYNHVPDLIHVPQLWILTIGNKFIATCSPTAIYNDSRSSITTCTVGRHPFPPTIRVTMSSGFVFCLRRDQCRVWFEFLYRVNLILETTMDTRIDPRRCVYSLQEDGSRVDGHRWPSVLQSHHDSEPLAVLVSPEESMSYQSSLVAIPLKGKYDWTSRRDDRREYPKASLEVLSPQTLDVYKIPYYWDTPKFGGERDLIIAQYLTELDLKILYEHTRRLRAMGETDRYFQRPTHVEDPYYIPPPYVQEAARAQVEAEKTQSKGRSIHQEDGDAQSTSKAPPGNKNPIFTWSIKTGNTINTYPHAPVDEISPRKTPTPQQQMRALLAHMHYKLLSSSDVLTAQSYNSLPLKTRSDIDREIYNLGKSGHIDGHIFTLLVSFVRRLSRVLGHFIDEDYDCIVKGKVWAAAHLVILTFGFIPVDELFSFHCEIFAIPLQEIMDRIQQLRDGLFGVENFYISNSIIETFLNTVILLVDASHEASRLMRKVKDDIERKDRAGDDNKSEPASINDEGFQDPSTSAELRTESAASQERGTQTDPVPYEDIEERFTADTRYSRYGPPLRNQDNTFSRRMWRKTNRIYNFLDNAQDEYCAMFHLEDDVEDSPYSGVDCGKIIPLVLQSVLQGHSTSASMPELDIEEIYVTYTTHLQLKARSTPSKNLLLDMNLLREELGIISKNISDQLSIITALCEPHSSSYDDESDTGSYTERNGKLTVFEYIFSCTSNRNGVINMSARRILQEIKVELQDKLDVFEELTKRTEQLEKQICQRVEIIQEDHGKAILVFTIVSTIFLPLSFVSSYLGMNTADLRDMEPSQAIFWEVAAPFTVVVVVVVLAVAYNVNRIMGWIPRATGIV